MLKNRRANLAGSFFAKKPRQPGNRAAIILPPCRSRTSKSNPHSGASPIDGSQRRWSRASSTTCPARASRSIWSRCAAEENARMTWWMLRILKKNNFTPDEVRLRKEVDVLKGQLTRIADEQKLVHLVERINQTVHRINTLGTNAIDLPVVAGRSPSRTATHFGHAGRTRDRFKFHRFRYPRRSETARFRPRRNCFHGGVGASRSFPAMARQRQRRHDEVACRSLPTNAVIRPPIFPVSNRPSASRSITTSRWTKHSRATNHADGSPATRSATTTTT